MSEVDHRIATALETIATIMLAQHKQLIERESNATS
jgi:hypothetical protein